MKMCSEVITLYNARYDQPTDGTIYERTVIQGVSWYGTMKSNVDAKGLKTANQYTIRIPANADSGAKTYVDPIAYKTASDVSRSYTLTAGDIIVHGLCTLENPRLSDIHQASTEVITVLAVTDNRRVLHASHFKVVGA